MGAVERAGIAGHAEHRRFAVTRGPAAVPQVPGRKPLPFIGPAGAIPGPHDGRLCPIYSSLKLGHFEPPFYLFKIAAAV